MSKSHKHIDHYGRLFSTARDMCAFHDVSVETYHSRRRLGYTLKQAVKGSDAKRTTSVACKDHKDNEFPSVKAMCEYYGVDDSTYYARLNRGCTLEQVLTGNGAKRTTSIVCKDHEDNEFPSVKAMCEYYGVSYNTYLYRLRQGYTLEQALTGEGLCKDYNGKGFKNIREMCEYHGVERSTYISRLRRGYTKEQALTGKKPSKKK